MLVGLGGGGTSEQAADLFFCFCFFSFIPARRETFTYDA